MQEGEVSDLDARYPFLNHVLGLIEAGVKITAESEYFETYLAIRSRGLVQREGEEGVIIKPSPRAGEYRRLRAKK